MTVTESYIKFCNEYNKDMDATQEKELIGKYRSGDTEAIKILLGHFIKLIINKARYYSNKYNTPEEDLIQEGNIGLIKSLNKYNLSAENRFLTYGYYGIMRYMEHYVYLHDSVVTHNHNRFKSLHYGKDRDYSDVFNNNVNRDKNSDSMMPFPYISKYAREEERVHNIIETDKQNKVINICDVIETLNKLNNNERDVIIKRYLSNKEMTFKEVAKGVNKSREWVRIVERRAIKKIKKLLKVNKLH